MAFNLFPKPPAKPKPAEPPVQESRAKAPSSGGGDPRTGSARELAASVKVRSAAAAKASAAAQAAEARDREITVTGPQSLIEWTPGLQQSIQVAEANPGLCGVLENAALLYANGQAPQAREILEQGISEDDEAKNSPLAWLALFDLLQRAEDKPAFDQLALQYVVAFERSAPAWEDRAPSRHGARPVAGGYIGLTGKLSAAHAPQ